MWLGWNYMKLEQFINDRMKRITFMIENSTKKIIKKEINKIKKRYKEGIT